MTRRQKGHGGESVDESANYITHPTGKHSYRNYRLIFAPKEARLLVSKIFNQFEHCRSTKYGDFKVLITAYKSVFMDVFNYKPRNWPEQTTHFYMFLEI